MAPTMSRSSTLTEASSAELLLHVFGGEIDLNNDAVHDKFREAIESDAVKNKTLVAIQDLNHTVRDIIQAFRRIRRDLQSFDKKAFRGHDDTVLQLSPEWDKLHEAFHEILDTSRDNATEAAAFMRQFTKTMLQDVDESEYPALKEELANFITMLEDKEEKANKAKKEFRELADDVHLFVAKIDEALQDAEEPIHRELNRTKLRIGDLHVRLREISEESTKMAIACVTSFATAALGVGAAIVTLSPEAFALAVRTFKRNVRTPKTSAVALVHSGSKLSTLLHEKKDVKQELKKCSKEAEHLSKRMGALHGYKISLESTKSDVEMLSSQISTFVNIWQSLKQDLHSFNEQLGYAAKPNIKINKFFPKKVANTRGLYTTLILLLEEYAKGSVDVEDEETLCDSDGVKKVEI
ncbi:hypothetical protein OH76DRAFT_1487727 [Lentinus brumalis]|uniref:Uncharacterized protein n=1 Tax=Lentinus brumalis TaxID=2498619 RepID=A0A371CTI0_9APHY|nr:hypothetical protein OH76DRAFT_1487727 [Polyporus brumalis]